VSLIQLAGCPFNEEMKLVAATALIISPVKELRRNMSLGQGPNLKEEKKN
jgi:hypothetical protein